MLCPPQGRPPHAYWPGPILDRAPMDIFLYFCGVCGGLPWGDSRLFAGGQSYELMSQPSFLYDSGIRGLLSFVLVHTFLRSQHPIRIITGKKKKRDRNKGWSKRSKPKSLRLRSFLPPKLSSSKPLRFYQLSFRASPYSKLYNFLRL